MVAKVPLGAVDQRGGFTTPTSDGTTVLVRVGYLTSAASASRQRSFCVLDSSGSQRAQGRRNPQTLGLYAADDSGNIYAFSLPASPAALEQRAVPGRWHTGHLR